MTPVMIFRDLFSLEQQSVERRMTCQSYKKAENETEY